MLCVYISNLILEIEKRICFMSICEFDVVIFIIENPGFTYFYKLMLIKVWSPLFICCFGNSLVFLKFVRSVMILHFEVYLRKNSFENCGISSICACFTHICNMFHSAFLVLKSSFVHLFIE